MKYLIPLIGIVLFFWLMIKQQFILMALLVIVLIIYIFIKLSKGNPKINTVDTSINPMVGEIDENLRCILYKLDYTADKQEEIIKAITFDNSTSFDDNNFKSLSDDEIKVKYPDGTRLWQYDDEYGIGDFKIGDSIEKEGIPIYARYDSDYILVGYISSLDSEYVNNNRNNIESIRLIYHGGYYKFVMTNKQGRDEVITEFEDYVLTLAVCYKN
ncbi:hypothetical protein LJB88_04330 [Erysipelotrichaceae bacterium OttesenSCG-928-M19]|nr:hypothetical protein [Erysipelotrichaceae bacterium OttesenSCG-928-M19]